jgi:hypothetical protein
MKKTRGQKSRDTVPLRLMLSVGSKRQTRRKFVYLADLPLKADSEICTKQEVV